MMFFVLLRMQKYELKSEKFFPGTEFSVFRLL